MNPAEAHERPIDTDPTVPAGVRAALVRRGFAALTSVQRAVLADQAQGRNLRISSQTGSGKTVALGFVLARALEEPCTDPKAIRGLVVVPTRELAVQVQQELRWLFADLDDVRVEVVTGGTDMMRERQALRRPPTILVATPGRLLDHVRRGSVRCDGVQQLVLDEADRMLDMGFREDLEAIVDALPAERHSHLVSATFPPQVRRLAERVQSDPLVLQGTDLGVANADIEHVACLVDRHDTYAAIVNALLLARGERVLVFVERRADASELADRLTTDGFAVQSLSGELSQAQRTRSLEAFRRGVIDVLVCTDVAARGIDVPEISLVIQADLPRDPDGYTHRAGRTGRAGCKGRSLLLVPPRGQQQALHVLRVANVQATWRPLPRPDEIHDAIASRARQDLRASLEHGAVGDPRELAHASALLREHDPAQLVAMLLRAAMPSLPCAPMPTRAIDPHANARAPSRHKGPHPGHGKHPRGAAKGARGPRPDLRVSRQRDAS